MQGTSARTAQPALLMTPDNQLMETGSARVSPETRSVEFFGEFALLFKMDTPLKVVLTQGDVPVQSFTGLVYLSAQNLLRLVDVQEQLLPGAKTACFFEVDLEGMLEADLPEAPRRFRPFRRRRVVRQQFPVRISRLSMGGVNFTADRDLARGQPLLLDIPALGILGLGLQVETPFEFGQELRRNYHCSLQYLPEEARQPLDRLVTQLCLEQVPILTQPV